jgi:predicted alpha-1,2-mannosidase
MTATRAWAILLSTVLAGISISACGGNTPKSGESSPATTMLVSDPASLVDPFAGTGTGAVSPGSIGEFPGADTPFGMVQWSPDTYPDRVSGSGYSYDDTHISGFSLTHLSGDGCPAYGDIPVLPTVGTVGSQPEATVDSFSHSEEQASPGRYSVVLGPSDIRFAMSVTTRTGIAEMTFPAAPQANVLFKVSGSANPVSAASVNVVGDDEVTGEVTSGQFCQTGTSYTLYFAAYFEKPFAEHGTWAKTVEPGTTRCTGDECGAYVSFDTQTSRTVLMKIGISFVSVANAESNIAAEDPGWSLDKIETEATGSWNTMLGRVRVGGGSKTQQKIFYTALYHSLLHPNVVSDANGQYMGDDGRVHQSSSPQYSNFSEWDIYRSEIELISMVAPTQAADMIQSLVNDGEQNGWLPKWAIADGDASQMNGDSADPIIAAAYAFGVRDFDQKAALAAMLKGAEQNETGHGLEIERQYLSQYISQHYVDANSLDLTSIDYSIGGSVTLEYAIDDFAIAQLAESLGDQSVYEAMMQRSHNWQYLFNAATGYIEAKNSDGTFPEGPAFQKDLFEPGGEQGFEEGNAIQYTWAVPQDLDALSNLMGGPSAAALKLTTFFSQLNAGRYEPYDWAGNEPSLWSPWEFDYFGAPWETQDFVRQIATTEYRDAPVNEPGNDDLGAISSWYVWAAIGLYPVTPGTANLAIASPLFPKISIELPSGHLLQITAPGASASTPYVHALTVSGIAPPAAQACTPSSSGSSGSSGSGWNSPWIPASFLQSGGSLDFVLSATPDHSWGAEPDNAPPSYATGRLPAVGFSEPTGAATVTDGTTRMIQVGVQQVTTGSPAVDWTATTTSGLAVHPSSGTFPQGQGSAGGCAGPSRLTEAISVKATGVGSQQVRVSLRTATGVDLPPVVLDVTVNGGS